MDRNEQIFRLVAEFEVKQAAAIKSLGELQQRVENASKAMSPGLRDNTKQAEGGLSSFGEQAKGLINKIRDLGLAMMGINQLVSSVKGIGSAIGGLAQQAAALAPLRESFQNLARDAGTSAEALLSSMRAAAGGLISDTELMTSANQAFLLVGRDVGTKFPQWIQIAQAAAKATGQSVSFMLDSIVRGIGRGSPLILDNLGLSLKLSEANAKYAASLGKTAEQLTAVEQKTALQNAVQEAGAQLIARVGQTAAGLGQRLGQLRVTLQNASEAAKAELAPAFNDLVAAAMPLVQQLAGQLAPAVRSVAGWISNSLVPAVQSMTSYLSKNPQIADLAVKVGMVGSAVLAVTPLILAFTAAISAIISPVGLVVAGLGLLAVVVAKAAQESARAEASMAAQAERSKANEQAILSSAQSYEEYERRAKEAGIASQEVASAAAGVTPVGKAVADGMWQASAALTATGGAVIRTREEWEGYRRALELTTQSTVNIAQAGNRMAKDVDISGEHLVTLGEVASTAASRAEEAARQTAEAWKETSPALKKAAQDGFMGMVEAAKGYYAQLNQATSDNQRASIEAEQAYHAKREALLKAGKTKEAAQLDAEYAREAAVRERNFQISKIQLANSHQQEMAQRRAAFGEKLILWLQENAVKLGMESNTAKALIDVVARSTGAQTATEAKATMDLLALWKARSEGAAGYAMDYLAATETILKAAQAQAEAQGKAAAGEPINWEEILGGLPSIPDLTGVMSGVEAGAAATETATEKLETVLTSVGDAISQVIENFVKVVGYSGLDIRSGMEHLRDDVVLAVRILYQALGMIGEDTARKAGEFASNASSVASFISSAIDAFEKLANYRRATDLPRRIASLREDVVAVISEVMHAGWAFGRGETHEGWRDIPASAAGFAEAATKVLTLVSTAVDALTKLRDYVRPRAQRFADLGLSLRDMISSLASAGKSIRPEDLGAVRRLADQIGPAAEGLQKGVDLLLRLVGFRRPSAVAIADFTRTLEDMLDGLIELAKRMDQDGRIAVSSFGAAVSQLMQGLSDAFSVLERISEYAHLPQIGLRLEKFRVDLAAFLRQMDALAREFGERGLSETATWASEVKLILEGLAGAFDLLDGLGRYAGLRDPNRLALFRGDLLLFLREMQSLAEWFQDQGVQIASAWAEAAGNVVGGLKDALTVLLDLGAYAGAGANLKRQAVLLRGDLTLFLTEMDAMARSFREQGIGMASAWAESAGKVVAMVAQAFEVLRQIGKYVGAGSNLSGKLALLEGDLTLTLEALDRTARRFGVEGLKTAAAWAENAGKLISAMASAFELLNKLADYVAIADLQTRVTAFETDILAVLWHLDAVAKRWTDYGKTISVEWAQGAGAMIAAMRDAFTLLAGIAEYVGIADLQARILAFKSDLDTVLYQLDQMGRRWGEDGLQVGAAFYTSAGAIIGGVKDAFTLLASLREYVKIGDLQTRITDLVTDLHGVLARLKAEADTWEKDALAAGAAWAQAAGSLLEGLAGAFEFLLALKDYVPIKEIQQRLVDFSGDLHRLLLFMKALAWSFGEEGLKAAAVWAEQVGKIVDAVGAAFEALQKLRVYAGGLTQATLTKFRTDLMALLREMDSVQKEFVREGLVIEEKFAAGIANMVSAAKDALSILGMLSSEPFHVSQARINEFGLRLKQLLKALAEQVGGLGPDVLDSVKGIGERITPALGALGQAWTVLNQLPDRTPPDSRAINAFVTAVKNLVSGFATIVISAEDQIAVEAARPTMETVGELMSSFVGILRDMKEVPGNASTLADRIKQAIRDLMTGPNGLIYMMRQHPEWADAAEWAGAIGEAIQSLIDALQGLGAISPATVDLKPIFSVIDSLIEGVKTRVGELRGLIAELLALAAQAQGLGVGAAEATTTHHTTGLQHGGLVTTPGTYRLAESGPELVIPWSTLGRMVRSMADAAGRLAMLPEELEGSPQRPWVPIGPGGEAPSWTWPQAGANRPVIIAPQITVPILGRVDATSRKQVRDLQEQIRAGILAEMPFIQDQVSTGLARATKQNQRYGVTQL